MDDGIQTRLQSTTIRAILLTGLITILQRAGISADLVTGENHEILASIIDTLLVLASLLWAYKGRLRARGPITTPAGKPLVASKALIGGVSLLLLLGFGGCSDRCVMTADLHRRVVEGTEQTQRLARQAKIQIEQQQTTDGQTTWRMVDVNDPNAASECARLGNLVIADINANADLGAKRANIIQQWATLADVFWLQCAGGSQGHCAFGCVSAVSRLQAILASTEIKD